MKRDGFMTTRNKRMVRAPVKNGRSPCNELWEKRIMTFKLDHAQAISGIEDGKKQLGGWDASLVKGVWGESGYWRGRFNPFLFSQGAPKVKPIVKKIWEKDELLCQISWLKEGVSRPLHHLPKIVNKILSWGQKQPLMFLILCDTDYH